MSKLARLMVTVVAGLALALIFVAGPGVVLADDQPDGSIIVSPQTTDGIWGPGTITATSDVVINAGVVITIAPGTTIRVADGVGFTVNGDLHSDGSVLFTATSATPGAWEGITYADGSSGYLNQATIEYARHALTLNTSNPITISNSELRYNLHAPAINQLAYGAGLYIQQGDHLIEDTRIYGNAATASGTGQVRGAGVYIVAGAPHILNSWIYENTATGNRAGIGGGIGMIGGSALIENSHILTNTLTGAGGNQLKSGGGIGFAGNTGAVIRDSWIAANRNALSDGYAGGGGIGFASNGTASLIKGNVIYANYIQGPDWCEGGGIDTWDTTNSVVINNNLIISNTSGACRSGYGAYGGGMNMNGSATGVHVVNNTIVGNQAGRGGGLFLQGGTVFALNNIIVNNSASIRGGGIRRAAGTADYNDIFGNTSPSGPDTYGSVGVNNISVNPLFLGTGNLAQQYHLQKWSPVIDMGTGSGTGIPNDDYDGESRPVYGGYDMGFDEVIPHLVVIKSADPDPVKPGEVLNYTIIISNSGPGDAPAMTVSDTLPINTQFVPSSIAIAPPTAGTAVTTPPTLATGLTVDAGQRVTVTYAVTVSEKPLPVGVLSIDNVVNVSGQGFGANGVTATRLNYDRTISGTLTISDTWGPGTITVTGDILIAPTVVITVVPDTTVLVANPDGHNLGVDDQRIEFIVDNGAGFRLYGPVTFTSLDAFPAPADWYGIRYLSGSHGWMNDAIIEYGVHALTVDTTNPITISNSHLRYNRHAPGAVEHAVGAGLYILQGDHLITDTHIYGNTAQASGDYQVRGAGVYVVDGASHILNSRIYENTATAANREVYGGGIGIVAGATRIENSYILTNTITGGSGNRLRSGAGIGIVGNTGVVIQGNWIEANINNVTGYAGGGGVGFASDARANLIDSNVISGNQAIGTGWGEGGALDAWERNVFTASNNLMYNNLTSRIGGAININANAADGNINVFNNTIVGNTAHQGGGIYRQVSSNVYNNILVGNHATNTGGGIFGSSGSVGYNDVWNNTPNNYNDPNAISPTDLQVDPLFRGAGNLMEQYHLRVESPLVDAGADTGTGLPSDDYDDDPRPTYAYWDIGFDEVIPDGSVQFVAIKRAGSSQGAGEPLDYTISVVNNDVVTPSGRITDVLPLHTAYSADPTCNVGTCGYDSLNNAITWTGEISPGGILNLHYTVLVDAPLPDGTEITNTATISMGMQILTTNIVTTTIYNPVLSVSKARTGGGIAGNNYNYRITVNNTDPSGHATGVVVTDTLPADIYYVSGGTLVNGNTVSLTVPSVPPGGSAWANFTVWTCQTRPVNANYRVFTSTQGVDSPLGPSYATNLTPPTFDPDFDVNPFLLDQINVGQTVYFTDATTSNSQQPMADWEWNFGDGLTTTGQAVSHVYTSPGSYTVALTMTDQCGFTDSTTKTLLVNAPLFVVTKTVEPEGAIEPGDVLSYTIVVSNAGPGYATGLTVSDPLPANTAYVPGSSQVTAPVSQPITYRDDLDPTRVYGGSDGTIDWSSQPWIEFGDYGGPTGGYVRVYPDLGDNSIYIRYVNRGVTREADLSGYTLAILTFEYRRYSFDNANDYVSVQVSDDGGASWTELDRFVGPGTDTIYRRVGYDITEHISSTTTIRFVSSPGLGGSDYFYVDNVQIEATRYQMAANPGTAPPTLSSGVTLNAGQRMTVTYAVTVTPPVAVGTVITNIASVTSDEVSTPATGIVTSTILNVAPVAVDDTDSTDEDTPKTTAAPGVLSNDTDINGDILSVTAYDATSADGASVTVNADGSYIYDPTGSATLQALAVGETLVDTFTYTADDGNGGSDTATVSITVTGVNDGPTANDDTGATDEDTALTVPADGVLSNDTDVDASDTLTVTAYDATSAAGASVTVNAGGSYTYDPTPAPALQALAVAETLVDTFGYTIGDGHSGSDMATVSITVTGVNDAPVAVDDVATTDEDSSVTIDVLGNDTDVDASDSHTVDSVDTTGTQGTVTNNGADVTYDPGVAFQYLAVGESATDVFVYTVSDGNGGTDTAVVTVTVTGVNDAPVANDDTATTDEDTAVNIDVLGNDTDVESDSLTVDSVTPPANGMASNYGSYVVYTPDDDFNGTDTFNYTARDGNGGFDTATVTVTVNPTNDAPVANNDVDSTDEDTAVNIDVLGNDTDVDGDSLTVDSVTPPANGMASNYGSYVVYTPDDDFNGTDTFDYTARDGNGGFDTATVTVTVNPTNDAPVANNDADSTDEDTAVNIDVLGNDTDVDGDSLFVDSVIQPANGTVINNSNNVTYTPNADFNGTDTFVYSVSDGNGGSDMTMVIVTVNSVNDDPVANDDSATTDEDTAVNIDVLGNDTDVDSDTLTVDAVGAPITGTVTINLDYTVTYTPNVDFSGTDCFTYTIGDGNGGFATAAVTVEVVPVNDAPVANNDTANTDEDTAVAIDVLDNDTDLDGDPLTVDAVGAPANGTVANNGSDVTYTPNADFDGTDVFTYTASDSCGGTDTATVTVTVNPVNDAPVANDDTDTTDEDTAVIIDVLNNDTDADNDPLTVIAVGVPSNGSTHTDTATVTYTPTLDFNGLDTFTYTVSDGNGGSDTATVHVTVSALNDAPTVSDVNKTGDENAAITFTLSDFADQFTDVDGDSLVQIKITALPGHGTLYLSGSPVVVGQEIAASELNNLTYEPDTNYIGPDNLSWNGSDGALYAVSDALVNLTISDVPSSITVSKTADPTEVAEPGGEVTFTVRVENTSAVDSITINNLVDDAHGDLNGQGTCVVSQTIAAGDFYECVFNATVGGNAGYSETDTVTASGSDDDGIPVSASDSAEVRIQDVLPSILVTKTVSPTVIRSGDSVDFGIQVYNTSVESVTLTHLDDTIFGDLTGECGLPVNIAVGDTFECVISRAINANHTNTITATAEDDEHNQATGSADASVDVIGPAIRVTKQVSMETSTVGETITYTYAVTNTGDVMLTDVIASDDRLGNIDLDSAALEPGQVATGVATHTVTGSDLPGPIVNTVMVTGTPPVGDDVTDTDTATVYIIEQSPPDNKVYLPLILNTPLPAPDDVPDLVVQSVTVTENDAQVVIKNQGGSAVVNSFWVDLYVAPNPPPTGVNQTWNERCAQGIVWGVTPPLLPLAPGGVITLTFGDIYYWSELSHFPGSLPAGTPIYVQVDSSNTDTTYGAVLESHEITGGFYNNINSPVYSTPSAVSGGTARVEPLVTGERPPSSSLPSRP